MLVLDPDVDKAIDFFLRRLDPKGLRREVRPVLPELLECVLCRLRLRVLRSNLLCVSGLTNHTQNDGQLLFALGCKFDGVLQGG